MPKLLAISSSGGHWVQLLRLRPAFDNCEVIYSSVLNSCADDVAGEKFIYVPDASRWDRFKLIWMIVRIGFLLLSVRPDIIITTGAAPGYVAIRLGKMLGAKTIWIDSIANVEQLSLSGQQAQNYADLWLTQWEHLAENDGPEYLGAVI